MASFFAIISCVEQEAIFYTNLLPKYQESGWEQIPLVLSLSHLQTFVPDLEEKGAIQPRKGMAFFL